MRKVIAALLLVAVSAAGGFAQEKKDEKKAKLGVGDAAPPLTKVTTWMNGSPVAAFEKDKVYVLEFWATWCGPCIAAMPHLSELQTQLKGKGLVVIGMTNKDDNGNNKESVTKFVDKNKGEKLAYPVAYSDGEENYTAYMEAAGQNGIPCSFVIGKDGKVAYIGHPMGLDMVLPKVFAGTWNGKADADATVKAVDELFELMSPDKPETGLEKLAAFRKKYPELAAKDEVRGMHLNLLLANKKWDDAKPLAEELIAEADKKKKGQLAASAIGFANVKANPDKKHFDLGVKALETALKHEDKDVGLMLAAVQVYTWAGNKEKANEYGKKAIETVGEKDRKQVEMIVEEIKKGK